MMRDRAEGFRLETTRPRHTLGNVQIVRLSLVWLLPVTQKVDSEFAVLRSYSMISDLSSWWHYPSLGYSL